MFGEDAQRLTVGHLAAGAHDAEALVFPIEAPSAQRPLFLERQFGTVLNAQRGTHLLHVKQEEAHADGRGQSGLWIDALADE